MAAVPTDPAPVRPVRNARTDPGARELYAPCPDFAGVWFHRATGFCSCGSHHSWTVVTRATPRALDNAR